MNSKGVRQRSLLVWSLLASIWVGSTANAEDLPFSAKDLAEIYVSVATSDPLNAPEGFAEIRKFSEDRPVEIVGAVKRSIYSNSELVKLIINMLAWVAKDIALNASDDQFIFYDYDETLERLKLNQLGRLDTSRQVAVVFGTKSELQDVANLLFSDPENETLKFVEDRIGKDPQVCLAMLQFEKKEVAIIKKSVVLVEYLQHFDDIQVMQCLYDGIFQALGLGGSDEGLKEGVFQVGSHGAAVPSELDWRIFAIHTSHLVRAGMSQLEANAASDQLSLNLGY